jgi:serine/threonine-protein kinase
LNGLRGALFADHREGLCQQRTVLAAELGGGMAGEDFPAQLAGVRAGSLVAGYRLEAQVGAGGMAVVFRARDERLGRHVALKILAPALAADPAFRRRFIAESRAAAVVDDPHIIPIYEAGESEGALFIAMRFVRGGDLRLLLDREGALPPGRAAWFISSVASALDAAHSVGLVHRDVKPGNILVDARPGRPDHVYLADFGIVKGAMSGSVTGVGSLGTPDYMAPEQISGRVADGRTDQYSLACVTFQLLTGEVPFQRDQLPAVIYAHLSAPPPSLVSRRPDLPAAVDQVVAKAMAKTAEKRYESCGDFADALREALGLLPYISRGSAAAPDHPRPEITAPPTQLPPAPHNEERRTETAKVPGAKAAPEYASASSKPAGREGPRPADSQQGPPLETTTGKPGRKPSVPLVWAAGSAALSVLLFVGALIPFVSGSSREALWQTVLAVAVLGVLIASFERPFKQLGTFVLGWNCVWFTFLALFVLKFHGTDIAEALDEFTALLAVGAVGNLMCAAFSSVLDGAVGKRKSKVILYVTTGLIVVGLVVLALGNAVGSRGLSCGGGVVLFAAAFASLLESVTILARKSQLAADSGSISALARGAKSAVKDPTPFVRSCDEGSACVPGAVMYRAGGIRGTHAGTLPEAAE